MFVGCSTGRESTEYLENENSARSFSDRSFFMDVRVGCPFRNAKFQDLEGLTEVFGGMSAGMSGPKLPLWAEFLFLTKHTPNHRQCGKQFGAVQDVESRTSPDCTACCLIMVVVHTPYCYRRQSYYLIISGKGGSNNCLL